MHTFQYRTSFWHRCALWAEEPDTEIECGNWTVDQVAQFLGVAARTVWRYDKDRLMPHRVSVHPSLWREWEIREWNNMQSPSAPRGVTRRPTRDEWEKIRMDRQVSGVGCRVSGKKKTRRATA